MSAISLVKSEGAFSLTPHSLAEAMELAKLMAASDMVPKDYRGKPANVIVAVQMGAELGLSPMQSIQNIAVINGRPSVWGDAMLALCQAHPSCQDIVETYDAATETAICTVRRRNREPIIRTFSVPDAKKANLWGKQGPWQQYPQRMLQMRARAFALRDGFADVLRGLGMAEENQDIPQDSPKNVTPKRPPAVPLPAKVVEVEPESAAADEASIMESIADSDDIFAKYKAELDAAEDEETLRSTAKSWTWADKDRARISDIYKTRLRAIRQQQRPAPWDAIQQQSDEQAAAHVARDPGAEG